ncbi:hypothetical protein ABIC50_005787 [Burkholderia sp. 567]
MGRKWTKIELELCRRVDEVLYYVWAPIGVAHSPAARDEYQGYLPKVFAMLQARAGASSMALLESAKALAGIAGFMCELCFCVAKSVVLVCPHCKSLGIRTPCGTWTPWVGSKCRYCHKQY